MRPRGTRNDPEISLGVGLTDGVAFAVPVQHVQRGDEELVGVLLLVACQVTRVSPHQVQQPEGNVGRPVARVELGCAGEGKKDETGERPVLHS